MVAPSHCRVDISRNFIELWFHYAIIPIDNFARGFQIPYGPARIAYTVASVRRRQRNRRFPMGMRADIQRVPVALDGSRSLGLFVRFRMCVGIYGVVSSVSNQRYRRTIVGYW